MDNLKTFAYEQIKEKILCCDYLPGQSLNEKQLAEEIGAGRTPVREALLALSNESLIKIVPRKGTFVTELTIPGIKELYQLRKIVEPEATITFKKQIDLTQLLDFDRQFLNICGQTGQEADREFYRLDIRFHQFIIDSTNNQMLIDIFKDMMQRIYRIGIYSTLLKSCNTKQDTYREHKAIIEAIISEDDSMIKNSYISHINHSLISSINTLESCQSMP